MEPKRRGRPPKNPPAAASFPEKSQHTISEAKIPTPTVAKEPARRGRPPKTKHSAPDDSTLVSQQSPSKDVLNPTKKLKMPETSGVLVTDQPIAAFANNQNRAVAPCPLEQEEATEETSRSCEAASVPPVSQERPASPEDPVKEHRDLLARISLKENKLRNLRLLQSYRDRNDYSSGEVKIKTWKKALRDALIAIDSEHPDPKPPLAYFVSTLCIDPDIIGFSLADGCFV